MFVFDTTGWSSKPCYLSAGEERWTAFLHFRAMLQLLGNQLFCAGLGCMLPTAWFSEQKQMLWPRQDWYVDWSALSKDALNVCFPSVILDIRTGLVSSLERMNTSDPQKSARILTNMEKEVLIFLAWAWPSHGTDPYLRNHLGALFINYYSSRLHLPCKVKHGEPWGHIAGFARHVRAKLVPELDICTVLQIFPGEPGCRVFISLCVFSSSHLNPLWQEPYFPRHSEDWAGGSHCT